MEDAQVNELGGLRLNRHVVFSDIHLHRLLVILKQLEIIVKMDFTQIFGANKLVDTFVVSEN